MSGERNLQILLQTAAPQHNPGKYVFCTVQQPAPALLDAAVATIQESEGTTLILPQAVADAQQLGYEYVAGWITLKVHSSLAAVGLTAAFSHALAQQNISCNVVAGYYHDHIFVAEDDVQQALVILNSLSE
ncbi:ACT domain-containing protein [Snodgrassella sp. ESL0253]|uniref:ACT domain-containing protein n=1 Tax=Snodgrassella sp. ESL0253 TaxID=2705031 RepID=UPI001583DF8B|nr:ACT domain-containing protein [Snodgrassella sp. ESL0253]NUE66561.1 ACT domain-containing protein [Snodgrassella sp. ESL0253]